VIYLLDTNTCIRYLNGRSPSIRQRLQAVPKTDIVMCAVVKAELFYGAAKSYDPQRSRARQQTFLAQYASFSFDDTAAEIYGHVRADLETRGTPIGGNDLQIAAIALVHNLTLVTHNTREFSRVAGLTREDWETTP